MYINKKKLQNIYMQWRKKNNFIAPLRPDDIEFVVYKNNVSIALAIAKLYAMIWPELTTQQKNNNNNIN